MFYQFSFFAATRARELSRAKILFSDKNWSQFFNVFLSVHLYTEHCFVTAESCFIFMFFIENNAVVFTYKKADLVLGK